MEELEQWCFDSLSQLLPAFLTPLVTTSTCRATPEGGTRRALVARLSALDRSCKALVAAQQARKDSWTEIRKLLEYVTGVTCHKLLQLLILLRALHICACAVIFCLRFVISNSSTE